MVDKTGKKACIINHRQNCLKPTVAGVTSDVLHIRHLYNGAICSYSSKLKIFTESLLHQGVVCEGNTLLPHPAMATFVDKLTHRLQVRVAGEEKGAQ